MNLDRAFIEERFLPDINTSIHCLKESLDDYLHPHQENMWSNIENLEHTLKNLLKAVKEIVSYLTREAKIQLREFLQEHYQSA